MISCVHAMSWPANDLLQIRDLRTSGIDHVITTAVYAIIGAVALQRGGEVANQTIRQKILNPLGIF